MAIRQVIYVSQARDSQEIGMDYARDEDKSNVWCGEEDQAWNQN